ncbi:MAG TPA: hypothetical protein ENH10_06290 [Bacteroidetes bacterium]|nr:hypothetical protein [Bacteroidota bacterium]HEX04751.1 hypothetical protein [Bacteroidota bacterium]
MDEQFYDIHEQTKYQITISKPEKVEDLSDLFITKEELNVLIGNSVYLSNGNQVTRILSAVVTTEVKAWAEKLVASGKKTLRIDDEDLLYVLKKGYLTDYTGNDTTFGRHGNNICYARRFKRKKTKVTQGDVTTVWGHMFYAFKDKFHVYPSHIPRYGRHIRMFKAFKKIVGWRAVRKQIGTHAHLKFYRQIWDNPEEHIK